MTQLRAFEDAVGDLMFHYRNGGNAESIRTICTNLKTFFPDGDGWITISEMQSTFMTPGSNPQGIIPVWMASLGLREQTEQVSR